MNAKVGINGFGRIGRIVTRLLSSDPGVTPVFVNDLDPDIENLAYLYNYDSNYGQPDHPAKVISESEFEINDFGMRASSERSISCVPWEEADVDLIVDSSGVTNNVKESHKIIEEKRARHVIVTHSPDEYCDKTIIPGVNCNTFDPNTDKVISSSICDANAISHVLLHMDEEFGIESGFITSLHPWLSYQNLVDASVGSVSNPGHFWDDYSLGRSSMGALIPKRTSLIPAILKVCPQFESKLDAISYRIPTPVVTSADLTLTLKQDLDIDELSESLEKLASDNPYLSLNEESLVSVDYKGNPSSAIIDIQWLRVLNNRTVKIVLWYDNEWGYCRRVVDLIKLIANST